MIEIQCDIQTNGGAGKKEIQQNAETRRRSKEKSRKGNEQDSRDKSKHISNYNKCKYT